MTGFGVTELVERRALAKRSPDSGGRAETQCSAPLHDRIVWVREAAQRDRQLRFDNLLHHVTVPHLKRAYFALQKEAAPGVDGINWHEYGEDLMARLEKLHQRVHDGQYRAQPVRRQWIPKADGRQRPLGIASVEDKVVQQAVVWVLEAIYEVDFLGFSYGFRPGRSQHDALDAVTMAIITQKVSWVLDADIEACFDRIPHDKLLAVLRRRLADPKLLRLIEQTLTSGVVDDGVWHAVESGVPQGAVISPLLANVYLHDAIDRWVHKWRGVQARGAVSIVRYADDFVIGFQYRSDGERLRTKLGQRLAIYGLQLHPQKTRLLEFGRFAMRNRAERNLGKPESFDFLGFTHCCGERRRDGKYTVHRYSVAKRVRAFLQRLKAGLRNNYAQPVIWQGAWLKTRIRGYFQYHAIPGNRGALETVRREACRMWLRMLRRRSQRHAMPWSRVQFHIRRWIPSVHIIHPYPNQRFAF